MKATDEQKSRAVSLFKDGYSVSRIATELSTSLTSVSRWLERAGLREIVSYKPDPQRDARIAKQYADGIIVDEICKRNNVSRSVVLSIARRASLPPRQTGPRFHIVTAEVRAKIRQAWNDGKPAQVIGKDVGFNAGVIRRVLLEEGIKYEPRKWGDGTGRWHRGEWRKMDHGYVSIKLLESDPYYAMVDAQGYVLEHRYVMAKHLGRPLTDEETVHHKNSAQRTNNKIGNLQLRKGRHGKHACYACGDCGSRNIVSIPIDDPAPPETRSGE